MPHEEKQEKTFVAVIGNGIMGHGIAEVFATAGHDVVLIGRNPKVLRWRSQRLPPAWTSSSPGGCYAREAPQTHSARITIETKSGVRRGRWTGDRGATREPRVEGRDVRPARRDMQCGRNLGQFQRTPYERVVERGVRR